jgi:HTH-type transcriptional regulator/antitoxin HigA
MTQIVNEDQYRWAVDRVNELLPIVDEETPLNDPNSIELVTLSNLVANYSDEHFAIGMPTLAESIKLRMSEMGLTQKALAQLLGISPARINDVVTGKKEPTYLVAREISKKLDIDASIVLGVC